MMHHSPPIHHLALLLVLPLPLLTSSLPFSQPPLAETINTPPLHRIATDLPINPLTTTTTSSSSSSPHTAQCHPPAPLLRPESHPLLHPSNCHPLLTKLSAMAHCSSTTTRTWRATDGVISIQHATEAPICRIDVSPAPDAGIENFGWEDVREAVEGVLDGCQGRRGGESRVGAGGFVVGVRGVVAWEQKPARRSEAALEVEREVLETRVGKGVLCFSRGRGIVESLGLKGEAGGIDEISLRVGMVERILRTREDR